MSEDGSWHYGREAAKRAGETRAGPEAVNHDPEPVTDGGTEPEHPEPTAETADGAFSAVIEDAELRKFLEATKAVSEEAVFRALEDGLHVQQTDAANVRMVDAHLEADAFEHYEAGGEYLGLNIGQFLDTLGLGGETVSIQYNAETRKLDLEGDTWSYALALIDPSSIRNGKEGPTIPDPDEKLELECSHLIDADEIDRVHDGADMVADRVRFETDADGPLFAAVAEGDTDDLRFEFGETHLKDASHPESVGSILSLEQLGNLISPMTGDVRMKLGDEMPAHFAFDRSEYCSVEYMVAPRIKSE